LNGVVHDADDISLREASCLSVCHRKINFLSQKQKMILTKGKDNERPF